MLKVQNLCGLIGQRYEMTWRENLLKLDWDGEFLKPFVEKTALDGYIGLGKCVDALVRFAAATQEPALLALREHVIDTLIKCQEPDGYLGLYAPPSRTIMVWDIHELSYVLWGLISDWTFFQHQPSLDAAVGLGDYLLEQMAKIDPGKDIFINKKDRISVSEELMIIGLDRALLALTQATGDDRYQNFAASKLQLETWSLPIVLERHGKIEGHAYAYLTRCMAQLDLYEKTGDPDLLKQTHRAMFFLTDSLGLVVTGSCGVDECWHEDQRGHGHLAETCTTAYLIRVCARLLRYEHDGKWADLMERTIYNALFAAQSENGRRIRYYTPFEGLREYFDKDTYCCPNNFRRIVAELPGFIYDWDDQTLQVNLYETSSVCIDFADGQQATIRQETSYPCHGDIHFRVELAEAACFSLKLRQPRWCDQAELFVNEQPVAVVCEKGFLTLCRTWQSGDQVRLSLLMEPRLVRGLARQQGKAAVMRGPVVYCTQTNQIKIRHIDGKTTVASKANDLGTFSSLTLEELPEVKGDLGGPPLVLKGLVHDNPIDNQAIGQSDEVVIPLTPYPDPKGDWTYFKVDPSVRVIPDHLLSEEAVQDADLIRIDFDPDAIKT